MKRITVIMISLIILFLIVGTPKYQSIKTRTVDHQYFTNELLEQVQANKEVDIKECTDFQWDELYIFPPYYSMENIQEEIGVEWTERRTYLGYLLFQSMEYQTTNEAERLLIFKDGENIKLAKVFSNFKDKIMFNSLHNSYGPFKVNRNQARYIVNEEENEVFVLTPVIDL